jgi:hypothetical protein
MAWSRPEPQQWFAEPVAYLTADGRIGPVVSELSENQRKSVPWCRIGPVVSDSSVGQSVRFLSERRN